MSNDDAYRLARFLSVSEARSQGAIRAELGFDEARVTSLLGVLSNMGADVIRAGPRGFLLKHSVEWLDRSLILRHIAAGKRSLLTGLLIEVSTDSTNLAIGRLPRDQQHGHVLLAEHQQAGRGRRGSSWHSPIGQNLYLSIGWRFERALPQLGCLPLVVAVAAARALEAEGLQGHGIKWPNDLLLDGRKLGGCLVEIQGDTHGPCDAVLGVGINVHMPGTAATDVIDQPWTDVYSVLPACSRNRLAALLIEKTLESMTLFSRRGFAPFKHDWDRFDVLTGTSVSVTTTGSTLRGRAAGIDRDGALLLETGTERLTMHSGEVSVRPAGICGG